MTEISGYSAQAQQMAPVRGTTTDCYLWPATGLYSAGLFSTRLEWIWVCTACSAAGGSARLQSAGVFLWATSSRICYHTSNWWHCRAALSGYDYTATAAPASSFATTSAAAPSAQSWNYYHHNIFLLEESFLQSGFCCCDAGLMVVLVCLLSLPR